MKRREDEMEEEPPLKKAPVKPASTQSAIFTDDALGYAFAVPPSFQVPAPSLNPAQRAELFRFQVHLAMEYGDGPTR